MIRKIHMSKKMESKLQLNAEQKQREKRGEEESVIKNSYALAISRYLRLKSLRRMSAIVNKSICEKLT